MRSKKPAFILTLICVAASFIVLLINWNSTDKWRFKYSLIGFIIFLILFLASGYGTFIKNKNRK